MLVQESSSLSEVVLGEPRFHDGVKKITVVVGQRIESTRISAIFVGILEITAAPLVFEEPYRMVLEEHSVYQKINRASVSTFVLPDAHLKGSTLLELEMRDKSLQQFGAYGLGT
jgi:hypothetical protein